MFGKLFYLGIILVIIATSVDAKKHKKVHKEHKLTVVKVADGDTITIKNHTDHKQIRIRFLCIDAPEKSQKKWGPLSLQRLEELLPLKSQVTLVGSKKDLYNRTLAEVINSKGVNTNLKMMEDGMVVFYPYQKGCKNYRAMEKKAKKAKKGIWKDKNFEKPWDYRKRAGIGYRGGAFDKNKKKSNKNVTKPHNHKHKHVTPKNDKSTTKFSWNNSKNNKVTTSKSVTKKMSWADKVASKTNPTPRRSDRLSNKSTISYKDMFQRSKDKSKKIQSTTFATTTTTKKKGLFNKLFNWKNSKFHFL